VSFNGHPSNLTRVAYGLHFPHARRADRRISRLAWRTQGSSRKSAYLGSVDRLIDGNPGQHRDLTDGVSELKIDIGPGYRVYYAQRGARLLLLLAAGDKSSQQKDIAKAIQLAKDFKE
jgi:putative addiction module killer protein